MTVLGAEAEPNVPKKRIKLSITKGENFNLNPQRMETSDAGVMLNGYGGLVNNHKTHSPDDGSPNTEGAVHVATLCNMGNTCFLNSVLYTLRFAPSFLHNLHHLAQDLSDISGKFASLKNKSSSLGRGIGASKTWSNKDLTSWATATNDDKKVVATLRLHELFEALHNSELKDHVEPFQPEVFLTALREVYSIFEGNSQHDAHELLVCLRELMSVSCRRLNDLHEEQRPLRSKPPTPAGPLPPTSKSSFSSNVRKSLKLGKTRTTNGVLDKKIGGRDSTPLIGENQSPVTNEEEAPTTGENFISEDFEGMMNLSTTCLECENTSERTESFIDLSIGLSETPLPPLTNADQIRAFYHSAMVTEDLLQDSNKYWCEHCNRYNEARRNVSYESLPRLLILQLKRFSANSDNSVHKVNEYVPTPLELSCFCKTCKDVEESLKPHKGYRLYGVIMHLGNTMASGHYISYVCGRDTCADSSNCLKDKRKTASLSGAGKQSANPEKQSSQKTLFRFFSKASKPAYQSQTLEGRGQLIAPCRSSDCCGAKLDASEPVWLECDDDSVRTCTKRHMEDILGPKNSKNSSLTPYLLFYSRI